MARSDSGQFFFLSPLQARLGVPPTFACVADIAMTLRGQPAAYWAGGFRVTDEFNPAARVLLQLHPLAFVAAALVSALLIVLLTLSLSRALAVPLAFVVTFGHAFAAAAWMVHGGVTLAGALGALMTLLVAERLVAWSGRVTGGMAGIPPALS